MPGEPAHGSGLVDSRGEASDSAARHAPVLATTPSRSAAVLLRSARFPHCLVPWTPLRSGARWRGPAPLRSQAGTAGGHRVCGWWGELMINDRLVSSQDMAAGFCLAAGTVGSAIRPARLTLAPGARWHARKENTRACAMAVCLVVLLLFSNIEGTGSTSARSTGAMGYAHVKTCEELGKSLRSFLGQIKAMKKETDDVSAVIEGKGKHLRHANVQEEGRRTQRSLTAHKADDLIGSVAMHEWSAREWSHITWSSDSSACPNDKRIVSDDGSVLREGDLAALAQRLWWYVSFAELFRLYGSVDRHTAADKAAQLMREEASRGDQAPSASDLAEHRPRRGWLRFGLPRHNSAGHHAGETHPSGPPTEPTELTWVEAPRSQGLAFVCVSPSENLAVVAVRGSVNMCNILYALKMWPKPTEEGIGVSVHSGFAQVADEMLVKIEPLLRKGMKIHLTGHSLGGAVSTILALRLKARGHDIAQVVAFGMPLVVWGVDQREIPLDIPLLRVEHPLDPIVHFPGEFTDYDRRAAYLHRAA